RAALRGAASTQQIGYFTADGSVVSTSSPAANSVDSLVQVVLLNYMGLSGTDANFASVFQSWTNQPQGLGSASQLAALTAFQPIVDGASRAGRRPPARTWAHSLSQHDDGRALQPLRCCKPHFASRFVDSVADAVQFCCLGAGAARAPSS